MPTKGFAAFQVGKAGVLRKRAQANDGVVAPIIAFAAVPPGNACSDQRAIQPSGKLLQSGEQRFRIYDDRQRLDQSDARMRLHRRHEPHDGILGHQAVGVQHDYMIIGGAEPLDPVFDITGFPGGIFGAMTIVNIAGPEILPEPQKAFLFCNPNRGVGRVAQRIKDKGQQHLPGDEAWLIGEHRASGERKYYLANLPAKTDLRTLAATIKARWICEQAHQQLKENSGLITSRDDPGKASIVMPS